MSHMCLARFLLTRLEQIFTARQTDSHKLDMFWAQGTLTCHAMGRLLLTELYFLDQCVIICVSHS